jgi:hypothetical protein
MENQDAGGPRAVLIHGHLHGLLLLFPGHAGLDLRRRKEVEARRFDVLLESG